MDHKHAIFIATSELNNHIGNKLNNFIISKPLSVEYLCNLGKIISKLSPFTGNLIEFSTVDLLNTIRDFHQYGHWVRQDPGFPDAVFNGNIHPTPGFEIKAWFPFATEMTARFRESQSHFPNDETYIAILAWLPEYVLWGKPKILDVCVVSALSVAKARDNHYHNPPFYLVIEPEDTTQRTANLQQTNTNGYVLQETERARFNEALRLVESWGNEFKNYSTNASFQEKCEILRSRFRYRLDTNFAKIDRIEHFEIEKFKNKILNSQFQGKSIGEWAKCIENLTNEDAERIMHLDESAS